MTDLLTGVLAAHGGLARWRGASTLRATVTSGGPFWASKGHPDFAATDQVEARLQEQHLRVTSSASGRVFVYSKKEDRVSVTEADGTVVAELDNPRATFAGYTRDTEWSVAQLAYFRGYALSHYFLEPYAFSWAGASAQEVDPWEEDGERWRVLSVTFPDSVDSHSRVQRYYFDSESLLRRMDYAPDVNGKSPVAHYVSGHQSVGGLVVPTQRRVHLRKEDGTADRSWLPISVDIRDVEIG
ncbi:hypothetical protein JOF53_000952 [Crossiella equi]|uniref:Uncharacterized protein n=1 Tax=Crossiella equi TaxID=130796 RepID=A0ABS5A663_9PSEU|nr:hypothetical protein [Crossiella equi]MBP2472080.1 hypothetical protein [Crossiella equi]